MRKRDIAFLKNLPLKANIDNKLLAVHGALHLDAGCESARLDTDARLALSMAALISHPSRARICAFGNTGAVAIYERRSGKTVALPEDDVELRHDAYYLINPGTVGAPRGADPHATYMLLDLVQRTISARRIGYNVKIPLAPAARRISRRARHVSPRTAAQRYRQGPRRRSRAPHCQTRRALSTVPRLALSFRSISCLGLSAFLI